MINSKNAGAILTIDVKAAVKNFLKIKGFIGDKTNCAVAIKTDAYGLGAEKIAPFLAKAGCCNFFVAHLFEGAKLRKCIKEQNIYVLHGIPKDCEKDFVKNNLTPVLNNLEQIILWNNYAQKINKTLNAVIHIDTGMIRLGLSSDDFDKTMANDTFFSHINPVMLMSHLACADEKDNPKNQEQLKLFQEAKRKFAIKFPKTIYSFANSAAISLGKEYHFDLVRPGIAIYGGGDLLVDNKPEPMNSVVRLEAKILQVQEIDYPKTVGYGATWQAKEPTRIATIALGYGDGLLRNLGNKLKTFIDDVETPCVGRLSMDLITIDVSKIPLKKLKIGKLVEIIGKNNTINDVAAMAKTANYEIITSLGKRYYRKYLR